ncbi:MAG: UDP-N-acetylmuramate dehydrogenase [Clostridia bacterium]|nr:UDP-N-acetylmuramate dehydrogenase [Clostridia bacterium]
MYKEIALFAEKLGATVEFNAPMKKYTSFKCGGNASLLITPTSSDSLQKIISYCYTKNIKPLIIGNGSNLLVTDNGINNIVIKIGSKMSQIELIDETTIFCEAGASLKSLCMFALENSLSGLEFAYGIPGTLGGAVYMNAGAYGGEMKDVLFSCKHIDENGNVGEIEQNELNLRYRGSAYTDNGCTVVSAIMKLKKAEKTDIKGAMDDKLQRRKDKQPLEYPSAGSTFKRPEGYFAGALIEESGLKGYTVGGAQVSEKHAGFVINKNNATATDIITLIKDVQKIVFENSGIMLETEVKIIGD